MLCFCFLSSVPLKYIYIYCIFKLHPDASVGGLPFGFECFLLLWDVSIFLPILFSTFHFNDYFWCILHQTRPNDCLKCFSCWVDLSLFILFFLILWTTCKTWSDAIAKQSTLGFAYTESGYMFTILHWLLDRLLLLVPKIRWCLTRAYKHYIYVDDIVSGVRNNLFAGIAGIFISDVEPNIHHTQHYIRLPF